MSNIRKKGEKKMCYKYTSVIVVIINIFAICKYFKIFVFISASWRKPQK